MFRVPPAPPKSEAVTKPIVKTMGNASGQDIPLKSSLSKDIPIFNPDKI
jgi:hypothetical protein